MEEQLQKSEDMIDLMNMTITNLQSALVATAKTQENIALDIARIGEVLTAVLENSDFGEFSFPDGESGSGGNTVH